MPASLPIIPTEELSPVVLHHGVLGFDAARVGPLRYDYYAGGIHALLRERGHAILPTRVHPTAGIARRARELKTNILEHLRRIDRPGGRVIVVAHSMGGLDARYMISRLGMADRVRTLVTLSTPHRGNAYASFVLRHVGQRFRGEAVARMLRLDFGAARDLTPDAMARFNDDTPDAPNVRYFSVTAARPWHRVAPIFYPSFAVVAAAEGANDGIVSVASGTWAEHLGTWPTDHLHMVNRRFVLELRQPTGDVVPRYAGLLNKLAREGLTLA